MRIAAYLMLLSTLALTSVATADENATSRLLGAEDMWETSALELHDVHGLWGGQAIYLDARGICYVERVDKSQISRRYRLELAPEEAHRVFRLAVSHDLVTLEIADRPGVPDEARPTIVLRGPGGEHRVSKWANDEVERFDAVCAALVAFVERTKGADTPPWMKRPYDPAWHPTRGAEVTVLVFSGRPDPSWNLGVADLPPILAKLEDLPEAEPVRRPGLGFRGFRLTFRGGAGPGANVEVFAGTVMIQQRDGSSTTHSDEHGLESWLREQAKQRQIELPE